MTCNIMSRALSAAKSETDRDWVTVQEGDRNTREKAIEDEIGGGG